MEEIAKKLREIIETLFGVEVNPVITEAPEDFNADFACNVAFSLAKELHKAPREIAEEIAKKYGEGAQVAGAGFLNFISPDEYFIKSIGEFAENKEKFLNIISQDEYSGKMVVCEFSDPNPFKVLHVGHLYTSIVGDAISRLIENAGGEVVRANFGGDVGLHVAKTLYVLNKQECDFSRLTIEDIAEAYVSGTRMYEEDEEVKEEIDQLNKEIYRINKEQDKESRLSKLYWKGRELSYGYFEDFYRELGVKFDKYYPESSVAERGLQVVKEHTPEVYEESEGATVFRGEKYGLHTRVFINKNGLPTYETKDVGLLFTKENDYHFDESIVITGNDIIDYMKVVLKSVEQYAPLLVKKTVHITHGNVRLPGNEKMSSRKGNFIKAVDVLSQVREKCGGEGSDKRIVLAAIKYGFLKYKIGSNIEFNIDECVSTTGNSGPYLLYSAVRAKKILSKCKTSYEQEENSEQYSVTKNEKKLCKKIMQLKDIVRQATTEKAPNVVCNYLYELSQEFSRFYENEKVSGSEQEMYRKKFVQAYLNVIEFGLGLLGIEIPEEM